MSRHPAAQQPTAIAILDGERRPHGVVVADLPGRLWAAMQGALRRLRSGPQAGQAAIVAAPSDFATVMRRVEDEVYDAV